MRAAVDSQDSSRSAGLSRSGRTLRAARSGTHHAAGDAARDRLDRGRDGAAAPPEYADRGEGDAAPASLRGLLRRYTEGERIRGRRRPADTAHSLGLADSGRQDANPSAVKNRPDHDGQPGQELDRKDKSETGALRRENAAPISLVQDSCPAAETSKVPQVVIVDCTIRRHL